MPIQYRQLSPVVENFPFTVSPPVSNNWMRATYGTSPIHSLPPMREAYLWGNDTMNFQNLAKTVAIAAAATLCSCAPSMPAATMTTIETSPDLAYETFCPSSGTSRRFTVDEGRTLSGIMQCRVQELIVVVFDGNGQKIRNLRLSQAGVIVDETFFMSLDSAPTLVFLTALRDSLDSSHEASPRARIRLVSSPE